METTRGDRIISLRFDGYYLWVHTISPIVFIRFYKFTKEKIYIGGCRIFDESNLKEVKIIILEILAKTFQEQGELPPEDSQLTIPLTPVMEKAGLRLFTFEGTREYELMGNKIRIFKGDKDWLIGEVKKDCLDLESIVDTDFTNFKAV